MACVKRLASVLTCVITTVNRRGTQKKKHSNIVWAGSYNMLTMATLWNTRPRNPGDNIFSFYMTLICTSVPIT